MVQAHGVYDVLHIGHKRHLNAAKAKGDFLVVSITADKFVGKGPNKPIFNHQLRAEMLAELECVDFVYINHSESAVQAIDIIKPNIFWKGQEYINEADDITGKISLEKLAAEKHGGRPDFSSEIVFSSSSLSNSAFDQYPESAKAYLEEARRTLNVNQFDEIFDRIRDLKILLIGETIIDEYTNVTGLGKPSKENIISTKFEDTVIYWGGAIPIANTISDFCDHLDFATLVGTTERESGDFKRALAKKLIRLSPLVPLPIQSKNNVLLTREHQNFSKLTTWTSSVSLDFRKK